MSKAEEGKEIKKTTEVGIQSVDKKEDPTDSKDNAPASKPTEIGGRKNGLEPTRYGDWEKNGRCIDF
jgi:hypothetical protein